MKAAFTPGTTFAGYRVDSVIGRGGMGVVYLARDLSLERPVALKLIAPELLHDERFRARFLREPKLAASHDHPNVIPIYDAGDHDGQLYLAMRYVQGTDLRTALEEAGRFEPERAIEVLAQVAGALDAAHRRGLVHRDVKPANVLLDEGEHVYLSDFGITKPPDEDAADATPGAGTLDYLAPEQIRGEPVDGRTDLYALACVLYECLTGTAPFRKPTQAETMWAHLRGDPPPVRSGAPINDVLRRALAKDKEERHATCSAFVAAAAEALGVPLPGSRAGVPAAARSHRRAGRLLALGGVLLLLAAVTAGLRAMDGDEEEEPAPQRNGIAAIEPDGTQLASFTDTDAAPSSLAVGEGRVWALGLARRTVARIDPETRDVERRFRLPSPPTHLAAGAGAVWVKTLRGYLVRLDPRSGEITGRVRLLDRERSGDLPFTNWSFPQVAVGAGAVWVINDDRTVSRIDPRTMERVATVPVDAATIAAGREGVWFIGGDEARAVTPIDPRTNRAGRSLRIGAQTLSALAVGGGHVWVSAEGDGVLWRIDPGPDPVMRTIDVGVGVTFLAYGAGAIWTANYSSGTVSRIDVETSEVKSSPVGAVQSLVAGEGSAWVSTAGAVTADGLPQSCGKLYARTPEPDLLIASDSPLTGFQADGARAMSAAVRFILERHDFRAGPYTLGFRACDDASPDTQFVDARACAANANAYARAERLIAVVGTYNSDCARIEIPILNRAPGGAVPMISPSNTYSGLTRPGMRPPYGYRGEPGVFYPTGTRNYLRMPPHDNTLGTGQAILAEQLGLRSVYVLDDGSVFWSNLLSEPFRYAARKLGIRIAGSASFDAAADRHGALMDAIERSGAQGVVLGGDPFAGADRVLEELRERFGPRFTLLGGFYFASLPDVLDVANGAAKGMYVATSDVPRESLALTPAAKRFVDEFELDPAGGFVLEAAQATEVLLSAIARSDGTRESVLEELKATRVRNGILGSFRFDRNGDLTPARVPIVRITGKRTGGGAAAMEGAVVDRVVDIPSRLVR